MTDALIFEASTRLGYRVEVRRWSDGEVTLMVGPQVASLTQAQARALALALMAEELADE